MCVEMDENKAYLARYAHELQNLFTLHWPAIDLCKNSNVGSIQDFELAWTTTTTPIDLQYEFKEMCCFKMIPNDAFNLVEWYMELTALHSCENSEKWLDKTKLRHTSYLRGSYAYDEERGGALKFLVKIRQLLKGPDLLCCIEVASRSEAISKVMANAFLLYIGKV